MLVAHAGTPAPIIENINKALRAALAGQEGTTRIAADGDFNLPLMERSQEVRAAAEGLAHLAAKALSREEFTLAHTSLL
jgi:hypothetical protein